MSFLLLSVTIGMSSQIRQSAIDKIKAAPSAKLVAYFSITAANPFTNSSLVTQVKYRWSTPTISSIVCISCLSFNFNSSKIFYELSREQLSSDVRTIRWIGISLISERVNSCDCRYPLAYCSSEIGSWNLFSIATYDQ